MSATDTFQLAPEFVEHLRSLRQARRERKLELRDHLVRESLSGIERDQVLAKTGSRCHICGGPIEGNGWEADHLSPHSLGGSRSIDNYLPAHSSCNGYRWFYGPEEFLWILKLGVWLRTLIERETPLGQRAATAFWKHECIRASRRKEKKTASKASPADAQ